MKKILSGILAGIISVSASISVLAENIDIVINGKEADFSNTPVISQNRVLVPMRDLFESIGAAVSWNDNTKCAAASLGNKTIEFTIGSDVITQNGNKYISDTVCQLIDDKTFVPLRIILELLDFNVIWNENDNKVEIETLPSTDSETNQDNSSSSEFELKVLELINIERTKIGLSSLAWSSKLAESARAHSRDMAERNFFSHTNPDGKSPFDRLKAFGISYSAAAENIAAGQKTPEDVVESWMNSDGHRENILSSSFSKMGVGYYNTDSGYKHYWTQCFTN